MAPRFEKQDLNERIKVAPRFELGMEALQASALPLGHATLIECCFITDCDLLGQEKILKNPKNSFFTLLLAQAVHLKLIEIVSSIHANLRADLI